MIQDIIDILDKKVKDNGASFILHREMKVHPKFKVYKTFCYKLYIQTSVVSEILSYDKTVNAPISDVDLQWRALDKEFLEVIIDWINDGGLTKLMKLADGTK